MNNDISKLAEASLIIAARGAGEYLRRQGWDLPVHETIAPFLRAEVKAAIHQALADAKEALACHMTQVAEQTFATSMVLAGVAAATAYIASQPEKSRIIKPGGVQ